MTSQEILHYLKSLSNPESVAGMARYGINPATAYGVSIPNLRKIASKNRRDHGLAGELWESGIHEARILASMIDDPRHVTDDQMERWVADFNSWDLCDQCCNNLFRKLEWAHRKTVEWADRDEEFVKRAGFVLMACLAVHDTGTSDERFGDYFAVIKKASEDNRNFVKKAVNWALRQIGKRSIGLNAAALGAAREIQDFDSRAAKWIASDAIRELTSEAVQKRLKQNRGAPT